MNRLKNFFKRDRIEDQLFLTALIISLPYFIMAIIFDLMSMNNIILLIIDASFFFICIVMIILSKKENLVNVFVNVFCALCLFGFVFFWLSSGGLQGGGAYVFPVVAILIILITRGVATLVFGVALLALSILLPLNIIPPSGSIEYPGLLFDFILNLLVITSLLLFFKRALDREHDKLENQNLKIDRINKKNKIQSTELELYNRDIELIKKNLEQQAKKNEITLKKENERILDYAFINAHLIRAPLSNIIGFTNLVDKDVRMQELKKNADELDLIVHQISAILHEQRES